MDDPLIAEADEHLARPEAILAAPGEAKGWCHALLRAAEDPTRSKEVRKLAAERARQIEDVLQTPVLGFPGCTASPG
jgi:hypothetical protein